MLLEICFGGPFESLVEDVCLFPSDTIIWHDLLQAFHHIPKDIAYFRRKPFTIVDYCAVYAFKFSPARSNTYFAFIDQKAFEMLECSENYAEYGIFVLSSIAASDFIYILGRYAF